MGRLNHWRMTMMMIYSTRPATPKKRKRNEEESAIFTSPSSSLSRSETDADVGRWQQQRLVEWRAQYSRSRFILTQRR
jgi:hypothetical protein